MSPPPGRCRSWRAVAALARDADIVVGGVSAAAAHAWALPDFSGNVTATCNADAHEDTTLYCAVLTADSNKPIVVRVWRDSYDGVSCNDKGT